MRINVITQLKWHIAKYTICKNHFIIKKHDWCKNHIDGIHFRPQNINSYFVYILFTTLFEGLLNKITLPCIQ